MKFFPPGPKSDNNILEFSGSRDAATLGDWAIEQRDKAKPFKLEQLVNSEIFRESCLDFNGVCIIAFLPHIYDSSSEERNKYIETVREVGLSYKSKPFSFLWSQGGDHLELEEQFNANGSGYPSVLALSVKKNLYTIMKASFT